MFSPYETHQNFYEPRFIVYFLVKRASRTFRSNPPQAFLEKDVLKICSKFTGERSCQSVISIKLLWNFIEITLWHGCSPVNLLHIFRTFFPKITSGGLLLYLGPQIWHLMPIEMKNLAKISAFKRLCTVPHYY